MSTPIIAPRTQRREETQRQEQQTTIVESGTVFDKLLELLPMLAIVRLLSAQGGGTGGAVDLTPIIDKLNEIGAKVDNASDVLNELWQYLRTLKMEKVITYIWAPGVIDVRSDDVYVSADYGIGVVDNHQNVLNMYASIEILPLETGGEGA